MALVIASNTYEVTKSMIENEEVVEGEDLSTKQIINRIFRWYVTEEKMKVEDAIESTIEWLYKVELIDDEDDTDDTDMEYKRKMITQTCMKYVDKKGNVTPLARVEEPIVLYANEIEELKKIDSDYRRGAFAMLVHVKVKKVKGSNNPNKLYYGIGQYMRYCGESGARGFSSSNIIGAYKNLYDNKWLDSSLDDFKGYSFVKEFQEDEEVYTIKTGFDPKGLTQHYYNLFGKEWDKVKVMAIDLNKESGYEVYDSLNDCEKSMKEINDERNMTREKQLKPVSRGTIGNILHLQSYSSNDFTFTEVRHDNDNWKYGMEKVMRSIQSCHSKLKKRLKLLLNIPQGCKVDVRKEYSEASFLNGLLYDLSFYFGHESKKDVEIKWFFPSRNKKDQVKQKSIISKLREEQQDHNQQQHKIEVLTLKELKEREIKLLQQDSGKKSIISKLREEQLQDKGE